MGKGYNLERSCVWFFKNQGIYAIRLHTRQQVGEQHTIDVIAFHPIEGLLFIQCKAGKRPWMSQQDKIDHLTVSEKWGAKGLFCFTQKGIQFQYLQSRTRYRQPSIKKLISKMKAK